MSRVRSSSVLWSLVCLASVLPVSAGDQVRKWDQSLAVQGAERVVLDLPVAEVSVTGARGETVEITMSAECGHFSGRCVEIAEDLEFEIDRRGRRMVIDLEGWPGSSRRAPDLEIQVRVPQGLDLSIDLGVGEISVEGMDGDIDIDTGVGEVTVRTAERRVREISLDTGIGEVDLRPRPDGAVSSGFLGGELRWRGGVGSQEINVDVGVGEIEVLLSSRLAASP